MKPSSPLERLVFMSVAHLQEFYDSKPLHDFFHDCLTRKYPVEEAFPCLDAALREHLDHQLAIPELQHLIDMYHQMKVARQPPPASWLQNATTYPNQSW